MAENNTGIPQSAIDQAALTGSDTPIQEAQNYGDIQSILNAQNPTPLDNRTQAPPLSAIGAVEPMQLIANSAANYAGKPVTEEQVLPTYMKQTEQVNPQGQQLQAPPEAVVPSKSMTEQVSGIFEEQKIAANAIADATANKATADAAAEGAAMASIAKTEKKNRDLQQKFDSDFAAKMSDYQTAVSDYKAAAGDKIVPGKILANQDTGQKLMTGIFVALGAIGSSMAGQDNLALKAVDSAIDKDLEAQKFNLDNKLKAARLGVDSSQYILAEMRNKFKDDMSANLASKAAMLEMTQMQLRQNMAKYEGTAAGAKAQAFNAQLEMQKTDVLSKLRAQEQQNAVLQGVAGGGGKKLTPMQIEALPEKMRERYIPDVGLASTNEGAKGLREMKTTVDTVTKDVKRLQAILETTGKSFSPKLRAEAESIRTSLIGRLRVPITGPGAMSDGERELLQSLIPDVTSSFSLDAASRTRLESLQKRLDNNYKSMLNANGISGGPDLSNVLDTKESINSIKGK